MLHPRIQILRISAIAVLTMMTFIFSWSASAQQDDARAGETSVADQDPMGQIKTHLEFLGYKCTATSATSLSADHPARYGFLLRYYNGGILIRSQFTGKLAKSKASRFEIANSMNLAATAVRFYWDEATDFIMETWAPGEYEKQSFSILIDTWHRDTFDQISKHQSKLIKYLQ